MSAEKLLGTSHAKVYQFLAHQPGEKHMEAEIVGATGVSRSAVNLAVRDLAGAGLIVCESRGRLKFYSADPADPVVRQFKVWETVLSLAPVLGRLRTIARRVVLFGSAARGADATGSDIDLFIVGSDRKAIQAIMKSPVKERRIQAVIVSNQELASLKAEDPTFYDQVQQGLILLEPQDEEAEP